jgi:predicted nucleic acid-binding protein
VVVAALIGTGQLAAEARAHLSQPCTAPELVDLEVGSALRRLAQGQRVSAQRAKAAIEDLRALPIERVPHRPLLERCWSLRGSVTFYDAAYVALAELLGTSLVTTDQRLTRAPGTSCPITVLR